MLELDRLLCRLAFGRLLLVVFGCVVPDLYIVRNHIASLEDPAITQMNDRREVGPDPSGHLTSATKRSFEFAKIGIATASTKVKLL